jgi:hypothetical protein
MVVLYISPTGTPYYYGLDKRVFNKEYSNKLTSNVFIWPAYSKLP